MSISLTSTLVPEVAVEEVLTHQPVGLANVTLVREVQCANAYVPMLVTPAGIVMLVREVQLRNAQ